ncbi:MAG: hypothetical protein IPP94_08675 [Ignavibacteria bacterium]|nr:hypothetical protein [Ignavibacteria bacterium]
MLAGLVAILFFFPASGELSAQGSEFDTPLRWPPRSVWAMGSGHQGAAMGAREDAFAYNPALLAGATDISLSLFRLPIYNMWSETIPIHSAVLSMPLGFDDGSIGAEYINEVFPETEVRDEANNLLGRYTPLFRSAALGYARPLSNTLQAGVSLRYSSWTDNYITAKFLSFSAGLRWTPLLLERKLHVGLSLLDMGDAVTTEIAGKPDEKSPQPSAIRLEAGYPAVDDGAMRVPLMIGLSKPLVGYGEREQGGRMVTDYSQPWSSFSALLNDWHDAPRDITVHTGVGFEWNRISLGRGFALTQRIATGNHTAGPKAWLFNVFTLSAEAALSYRGITAVAGLATEWQHLPKDRWYLPQDVPREMFQFALRVPAAMLGVRVPEAEAPVATRRIILSAGAAYTLHLRQSYILDQDKGAGVDLAAESAFYTSDRSALVMTLLRNQETVDISRNLSPIPNTYELTRWKYRAQYRWHPAEAQPSLFVQGGAGIVQKRIEIFDHGFRSILPELLAGIGAVLPFETVVVQPYAEFSVCLEQDGYSGIVHGYSDAGIGVKVGYVWR